MYIIKDTHDVMLPDTILSHFIVDLQLYELGSICFDSMLV